MADDALYLTPASTPRPLDLVTIERLLITLDAIPYDQLAEGSLARSELATAICRGEIDNLYTPLGHDAYVIAWANRPAREDPRQSLSSWLGGTRGWEGDADA